MNLKEAFVRFRTWQKTPRQYTDQNLGSHLCANCGHEYTGNFCPLCGQNANEGRITWRSVGQSLLNIWNLDSRSLPITLWQLLLRPGYLIGEFINGRRRVCQPPLNTLFAVAVIYVIIMNLIGFGSDFSTTVKDNPSSFEAVSYWLKDHPAWGMMSATIIMIVPTWILFRFAPLNTHHTLPQSFFIQIFMSSLMLICVLLSNLFSWLFPLVPLYYYITYRQLFGYKFWGTLWRLVACGIVWFSILTLVALVMFMFDYVDKSAMLIGCMLSLTTIAAILAIGYWISKKTSNPTSTL